MHVGRARSVYHPRFFFPKAIRLLGMFSAGNFCDEFRDNLSGSRKG